MLVQERDAACVAYITDLYIKFTQVLGHMQELLEACVDDLHAVRERDAACVAYIQPLLFFKGFQALQAYRLAHWLWGHDRKVQVPADVHADFFIGAKLSILVLHA